MISNVKFIKPYQAYIFFYIDNSYQQLLKDSRAQRWAEAAKVAAAMSPLWTSRYVLWWLPGHQMRQHLQRSKGPQKMRLIHRSLTPRGPRNRVRTRFQNRSETRHSKHRKSWVNRIRQPHRNPKASPKAKDRRNRRWRSKIGRHQQYRSLLQNHQKALPMRLRDFAPRKTWPD